MRYRAVTLWAVQKAIEAGRIQSVGEGTWQLVRSFGGHAEPVLGIVQAPQVFIDGAPAGNATVSPEGTVSFTQAPPAGAALSWTGTFHWRCRFLKDGAEFSEFLSR